MIVRDLGLVVGYKLLAPRGYELDVNVLGKAATWILYAALAFVMVTHKGTTWPLALFWTGLALAALAAVIYVATAWRQVRA